MKYFDTVYKKQNQAIELFAPVILQEVAIIKDTVDDIVQLRNIFYNASTQDIIAVAVKVTQSDVFGEPIATPFEYVYEDILSHPSEIFGNKTAIDLHPKARRVQVDILKAVLQDGTVWVSDPENIVHIQPQHEIEASDEFISGIDDNPISPVFYYVENDSCWQCTCGEPNKSSSLKCHRCNRMRDVVKERFDRATLTLGFSEYQKEKEREKAREEEERAKQQESTGSPESSKRFCGKTVYLLLAVVAALAVIIFLAVRPASNDKTSDNTQTQETDSNGPGTEPLLFENDMFISADKIYEYMEKTILDALGYEYSSMDSPDGSLGILRSGDSNFTYLIECAVEDWTGLKRNDKSIPDKIVLYDVASATPNVENLAYFIKCFEGSTEYADIVEQLNNTKRNFPESKFPDFHHINISFNGKMYHLIQSATEKQEKMYAYAVFSDDYDYTNVDAKTALGFIFLNDNGTYDKAAQLSDEKAKELVLYYRTHEQDYFENLEDLINKADAEPDSTSENIEREIETTKESLKPYLDMIGTETAGTSVTVDDEFLNNMNRVYVMGQIGTVNHAYTDSSSNYISLMEWISNESIEETDFNNYIKLLDQYFNDTAILSHYDNVTSEDVWAWHITKENLWPICYMENGRINIRWYDKSAVDIPDDADNEN